MAFPDIRVNSSTGSNTAASGAGPNDGTTGGSTLTGAAGATDGAGTVVTLDGSPDLSNVAVDGSHVIWFNNTTAGAQNWAKITAKANSGTPTAQVTVTPSLGATLTKGWAIGGKRQTLEGSIRLMNNNSATGDLADFGGKITMESGYTETLTAQLGLYWTATTANGCLELRGDPNAGTRPVVTQAVNTIGIRLAPGGAGMVGVAISGFDLIGNTGSTQSNTANVAISGNGSVGLTLIRNMLLGGTADNQGWYNGIAGVNDHTFAVINTTIKHCYNSAFVGGGGSYSHKIIACLIDECDHGAGNGYGISATGNSMVIEDCVIARCRGDAIRIDGTGSFGNASIGIMIRNNNIYKNGGDGIELTQTPAQSTLTMGVIENNNITQNGGYALNFSGASITADELAARMLTITNNNYGTGGTANTSGACNLTLDASMSTGALAVDPALTDADNATEASRDFTPGTNLKAAAYPTSVPGSTKRGYKDVGAWQRQEAGGGGGLLVHPGMGGGMI